MQLWTDFKSYEEETPSGIPNYEHVIFSEILIESFTKMCDHYGGGSEY